MAMNCANAIDGANTNHYASRAKDVSTVSLMIFRWRLTPASMALTQNSATIALLHLLSAARQWT